MFTGLVESKGVIKSRKLSGDAGKLVVVSSKLFGGLVPGESIAVNGCCLTLENFSGNELVFHVLQETFSRTNLGMLPIGGTVNLERAMRADGRFGGHIVSGHIDGTGKLVSLGKTASSDIILEAECSSELMASMVPKGSIAIDGISLTIASLGKNTFTVHIIPTTWNETNLSLRKVGDVLNLESDMLGKYVKRTLEAMFSKDASDKSSLTLEDLLKAGF